MIRSSAVVVVVAAVVASAVVLRRRFVSVLVQGTSMEPTLRHGERVLVRRAGLAQVRRGQVVVFALPVPFDATSGNPPWMIKRVVALPGDPVPWLDSAHDDQRVPIGRFVAIGDNNPPGYARRAGPVAGTDLLGIAVGR